MIDTPMLIWLAIAAGLCSLEFFFPTAFVAFMLGIGALGVAAVLAILPISSNLQILLWLIFSTVSVIGSRRFFTPKTTTRTLSDAAEAETLTAIAPGKPGRVLYEGNSWRAKCADETMAIAPEESVYVVRQEGTTLYVMPCHLLE